MAVGQPSYVPGDLVVAGSLQVRGSLPIPSASIGDAQIVNPSPGNYIQVTKLGLQRAVPYAQPNVATVFETRPIHRVFGATGVVQGFYVGSIAAAIGAATVTVDLKKNGVSILTAPVTLNNANVARVCVGATLAGGAASNAAANDLFEVVVAGSAGGGTLPTGLFAQLVINEDPQ